LITRKELFKQLTAGEGFQRRILHKKFEHDAVGTFVYITSQDKPVEFKEVDDCADVPYTGTDDNIGALRQRIQFIYRGKTLENLLKPEMPFS
jgi:hypothetical protein